MTTNKQLQASDKELDMYLSVGIAQVEEERDRYKAECEKLRMDAKRLDWIVSEGVIVSREQIREVFLRNGFTIKDGRDDLADYVYAAAYELLATTAKKAERCE